jgi:hypothetical protein
MNSRLLTYNQWLNEAEVSHDIERCRLDQMTWTFNDLLRQKFEKDNDGVKDVKVYVTEDQDRNLIYTFMTWSSSNDLYIHLNENKMSIFEHQYDRNKDKIYYDQDCQIILGFKIKN